MITSNVLAGSIAALSAMAQVGYAQSASYPGNLIGNINTNFTFTDCAAPSDMQTCWNGQNITDDQDQSQQCTGLEIRIDCALSSCWNRVYSCDYQQLVNIYNITCGYDADSDTYASVTLDLPFYPPPANVSGEGECSCDISKYLFAIDRIGRDFESCSDTYAQSMGEDEDAEDDQPNMPCSCCYYGASAFAMNSICPSTDPEILQLSAIQSQFDYQNQTAGDCPTALSNFSCPNNAFGSDGQNASAWAQATLPTSGTGQLTDAPGVITTPVSGATYTWTGINSTYTITAASTAAQATKTAASVSGSASGTSSASPTASSGAASMSTEDKNSFIAFAAFAGIAFSLL